MNHMEELFLKILEMNLAGCACILAVLALRLLLRRKPRSFSYVLWAVVFLRLLCPFTLQSRYFGLSLGNMEQRLEAAAYEQEVLQYQTLVHKDGTVETSVSRGRLGGPAEAYVPLDGVNPAESAPDRGIDRGPAGSWEEQISRRYSHSEVLYQTRSWVTVGSLIWGAGAAALLGYSMISYLLLRRRLRQAVRIQEGVYESERIATPFLLGVFDPRIYLPVGLSQEERAYVLAHELAHLKRRDYLVKVLAWLAVSLHWFNPLVWLAYGLMVRDMEMSCDEQVIRRLGEGNKKAYSQALLAISSVSGDSFGRRVLTITPLGFGENDIRSRVKNILAYRGVKLGTGVALAVLFVALGLLLMTDNRQREEGDAVQLTKDAQTVEPEAEKVPGAGGSLDERELTELERIGDAIRKDDASGVDGQGGSVAVDPQQKGTLGEESLTDLERLQKMDRGSEMTWELLQTLVEADKPRLEDYAGYAGASWSEYEGGTRRLFYYLEDADNGQRYRLDIYCDRESLELDSVYLYRESDGDQRLLYWDRADGSEPRRYTDIAAFRRDIRQLGDWVSGWELPHEEQVQISAYRADLYLESGGVLFRWKEESRNLEEMWAPEEWKSAGGFMQVANMEEGETSFVFDRAGHLTDMVLSMNHSEKLGDGEVLEDCQEQAVLIAMNHDLYTISDLEELAEAGRPVPEEESTANIWYIGFAREDAPYAYILFLSERYYTREEAIAMARSVRFTQEAWNME